MKTLLASKSSLGTWDFNEGQDSPFQRQGSRDQSPSTDNIRGPARASCFFFLSFTLISICLSNFGRFFFLIVFLLHSLRFSSHLPCWFLCHLIQLSPAGHNSLILALSWPLEMEMCFPTMHFSQIASEGLSLMLLCSLGYNPEISGDLSQMVPPYFSSRLSRANPGFAESWFKLKPSLKLSFFAKVLFWKQNLLWENWENLTMSNQHFQCFHCVTFMLEFGKILPI